MLSRLHTKYIGKEFFAFSETQKDHMGACKGGGVLATFKLIGFLVLETMGFLEVNVTNGWIPL